VKRLALAAFPAFVSLALGAPPPPETTPGDLRIDPKSGREAVVWRKSHPIDWKSVSITLDFPDVTRPFARGSATLTGVVGGVGAANVTLDCDGPQIRRAVVDGAPVASAQHNGKLVLETGALAPGASVRAVIDYDLEIIDRKGVGLTFSPPKDQPENETDKFPVLHVQGEAEWSHTWFPCQDAPFERMASDVTVIVDDGYEVVSNGLLASRAPAPPGERGQPRTEWRWVQSREHPVYLITLVIGKFGVVDVGGSNSARPGLPMPVYVPLGREEPARESFGQTPAMLRFFEDVLDEPFPWDKYAQACVRGFKWGGMENTSCTILYEPAAYRDAAANRDLIAHELAHQWFGDLVTCRHWDHLWLNEGFAVFCEGLWREEEAGGRETPEGRAAYDTFVRDTLRGQILRNKAASPQHPAMVSARYTNPDEVFGKTDNPYPKGALVLHMLRKKLGDGPFFAAVRDYLDQFAGRAAETEDLRRVMEKHHGRSLEEFFAQWTRRPGIPRLRVSTEAEDTTLRLSVEQTQPIDGHNPPWRLEVPVRFTRADGGVEWEMVRVEEETTKAEVPYPSDAVRLEFDPELTLAASIRPRIVDLQTEIGEDTTLEEEDKPAEPEATPAAEPENQIQPAAAGQ